MKAIILAAGKAPRLLPLTKNSPKSMLKIGKKTILEVQVDSLRDAGIKDVTVITGYLAEKLERLCEKIGVKTLFDPFYACSGMAMTLWIAKNELKDSFLFLYSDVLFEPGIIKGLLKSKGDVCVAIRKGRLREEAEKVVEKDSMLTGISKEKINGENGEFIGIVKFSGEGVKKLLEELDNTARTDINAYFIDALNSLIKNGEKVTAYDIQNSKVTDIDFTEDLEKAEEMFR